jgi:hypothetical protein
MRRRKNVHGLLAAAGLALALAGAVAVTLAGCEKEDDDSSNPAPQATSNAGPEPAPATAADTRPVKPSADPAPRRPALSLLDAVPDDTGPIKVDRDVAKVIQTLSGFDHPSGTAATADGKYLFVTNSSRGISGFRYGRGSVSKLEVDPDGRLKMLKADFAAKLHAPVACAVSPKATGKFPAGSLFVTVGTTQAIDEKNEQVVDIKKFNPGVMVFDPNSGDLRGFIAMGPGYAVARKLTHPVITPAGICFDGLGNLYVADSGNTGRDLVPEVFGFPEIVRIKLEHIDAYAQNRDEGLLTPLQVGQVPSDIYHCTLDDGLYWTTLSGNGAGVGGVYRMERDKFPQGNQVSNVLGGQGPLTGLLITPNRFLVVARQEGDLQMMNGKILTRMFFDQERSFSSPMHLTLLKTAKGHNVLYVPEQQPGGLKDGAQRVRVVLLPGAL